MQSIRNFFGRAGQVAARRQVRYGTNALVMTLAFIAILVIINILATRYHYRWDLTAEGAFSLSPETIEILENLEQPVNIIGFFNRENQLMQQQELESRLDEYTSRTNLISYEFVDPDSEPVKARAYEITTYGTVVVESGERRQQITATDEQALTGAILKITRETQTTVYFLTGHDERSIEDFGQTGYAEARRILEQDGFLVQPINLVISNTIPLTNSVLVVADPQDAFQEREEQAIAEYLSGGGRLLLLSNPLTPAPLTTVMQAVGLQWNDDIVIDQVSELGNPVAPVVGEYPFSPITSDLNAPSIFPTVRTISQTETLTGTTVTPLLNSSPNSQAATDFAGGEVQLSPDDARGPLNFGYSIEGAIAATGATTDTLAAEARARVVVIGDADFASNTYLRLPGIANADLFRSAVAWLGAQDDEFTLPPRPDPVDRTLVLTDGQSRFVFYASTLGLPLLVILAGVWVWWERR